MQSRCENSVDAARVSTTGRLKAAVQAAQPMTATLARLASYEPRCPVVHGLTCNKLAAR